MADALILADEQAGAVVRSGAKSRLIIITDTISAQTALSRPVNITLADYITLCAIYPKIG